MHGFFKGCHYQHMHTTYNRLLRLKVWSGCPIAESCGLKWLEFPRSTKIIECRVFLAGLHLEVHLGKYTGFSLLWVLHLLLQLQWSIWSIVRVGGKCRYCFPLNWQPKPLQIGLFPQGKSSPNHQFSVAFAFAVSSTVECSSRDWYVKRPWSLWDYYYCSFLPVVYWHGYIPGSPGWALICDVHHSMNQFTNLDFPVSLWLKCPLPALTRRRVNTFVQQER